MDSKETIDTVGAVNPMMRGEAALDVPNGQTLVKLAGTEVSGIEERDEHWTTVTYTAKEPEPSVHGQVCGPLADMRDEITENICQLTDLLSRLRRLHIAALDGDADAIEEAEAILYERSFIDEDHVCAMDGDVGALEELVDARTKEHPAVNVKPDEIESTVRTIALPFIEAGEYVQVRTRNTEPGYVVTGARITTEQYGHYVTVTIYTNVSRVVTPPPPGTTVESAYQKLVEAKGEDAAKMIYAAVQSVAKDLDKQAELLGRALAACAGHFWLATAAEVREARS